MMSREDVLEELELLPIWQARAPNLKPATENLISEVSVKEESIPESEVVASTIENRLETIQNQLRLIVSEDAQWLFVMATQHSSEAENLLQNMLKAVSVKAKQDITGVGFEHLEQYAFKVIVVMGEAVAQQLLNKKQILAELRGETHQYQGRQVIATYSPSELLVNLSDKAGAWEDLCLAKFTIANL